jgi:pilus assembly protein Flp/PilA
VKQIRQSQIKLCTFRLLTIGASFAQRVRVSFADDFNKRLIMHNLKRFLNDEAGATAIEYGLIAALVAVVIITGITAVGTKLSTTLTNVSTSLR